MPVPPPEQSPIRMARPQRREQLLDTARRVFSEKGFHQTTMDDIAESAQVSKPVLYQHFKGKIELYEAVLDAAIERFHHAFSEPLAHALDNKTRTQQVIQNFLNVVLEDPKTYQMLFESDSINSPSVASRVRQLVDSTSAQLSATIRDETDMPVFDTDFLARALLELAIAASRIISQTTSDEEQKRQEQLLFKLVWRGMDMVDTDWA